MKKLVGVIISIIAIITFSCWFYFCPIFNSLPKPTGPFCVGYTKLVWTAEDVESTRATFPVELFYPATCIKNISSTTPYPKDKLQAIANVKGNTSWIPSILWNLLLRGINVYAHQNAPLAEKQTTYPVLIYLPGIGGVDLHNIYLEELASHGYIICAIQPPYDTEVTVFPDNTVINLDSQLQKAMAHNNREAIYAYRNNAHIRWTQYIETALKQLHVLNNDPQSPFFQKLDLNRLGLLGHSHGGAVATDFCQKNLLCKAGVNMDGWTKTYNKDDSFKTPFLFMLSESGEMPGMKPLFDNNMRPDFHKVIVTSAGHAAFNDFVLIKQPLTRWFGIVTGNTSTIIAQIKKILVTFFDQYNRNHIYDYFITR